MVWEASHNRLANLSRISVNKRMLTWLILSFTRGLVGDRFRNLLCLFPVSGCFFMFPTLGVNIYNVYARVELLAICFNMHHRIGLYNFTWLKIIHIGGNQNIFILYIRRNILQWTRVGKAWRKLESLRAYMMREKEERRRSIWNGKLHSAYKWGLGLLK